MVRIKREKQPLFESAFEGKSRENQLNIRIFDAMNEALEAESKRVNQPVPDLVREAIAFILLPGYLKGKVEDGVKLESQDRSLLEAYRAKLSELVDICGGIDESSNQLELQALKEHIKEHPEEVVGIPGIQELIETMAKKVVTELFGDGKKLPLDMQKRLEKILDEKGGKASLQEQAKFHKRLNR